MGALKPWHIAVLVVVLILLFGAKRLPDAARSLGRSMRILKAETRGLAEDDVSAKAEAQSARQPLDSQASPASVIDPVERVRDN
jgi:sec-independent protein translocase protein TatA